MKRIFLATAAVIWGLFFTSCGTGGLSSKAMTGAEFESLKPSDNAVFQKYSANKSATYATNWTRGLDLSGVSWNRKQTATMISPLHFVSAAHYPRKIGQSVVLHDSQGKLVARKVVDLKRVVGADVSVGLLDRPVPSGIKYYPVPRPGQESVLVGRYAVVTEQNKRIFRHRIKMIKGNGLVMAYHLEKGLNKRLIKGDSGNPSFYLSGDRLVLLETHTGGIQR